NMKKIILLLIGIVMLTSCGKQNFNAVDAIMTNAISERTFPGAVLIVGNSDRIIHEKAYGKFTYADDAREVTRGSMFDLASLTKPLATAMCAMKCIDSGLIDPEDPVDKYLPEFTGPGKDAIKVKHLLMHNSGLPSYTRPQGSRQETLDHIMAIDMNKEIGEYTYSCLNFITLMRVVESAAGMMMWEYYKKEFTDPMGMKKTMFSPPEAWHAQCLPTIGDSSGTKILRQGIVHDPLALALEGYSGNAGLFSTVSDLAALCQMMLNHGTYKNKTYVSKETILPFITLQSKGRTYGWAINDHYTSAGKRISKTAIGHTGYTGTSAWIDYENDIFIVLLTNRVYPDDKVGLNPLRRAVHNAVMEAVFDLKPDTEEL
ncbi:MAG: beta-lactamase family protein, partial [FCB group bacterium]|nr:beta-lactamase family protein [FCB group bacterium]